jgi:hypothetical protein
MNELPMSRARAERLLALDGNQHPRGSNPVGVRKTANCGRSAPNFFPTRRLKCHDSSFCSAKKV